MSQNTNICNKCGLHNDKEAKFCRSCGCELLPANVMDRYPKLKLRPTSLYSWKEPQTAQFFKGLFGVIAVAAIICFIYSAISYSDYHIAYSHESVDEYSTWYSILLEDPMLGIYEGFGYDRDYNEAISAASRRYYDECLVGLILSGLGILLFGFLAIRTKAKMKPKDAPELQEIADYIQDYNYTGLSHGKKNPLYKFFVKNEKFGVLRVDDYSIQIPAQYDMLEWREKGRMLTATTPFGKCILDINGKVLQ